MSIARTLVGLATVVVVGYGAKKLWDAMSDGKKTVVKESASVVVNGASAFANAKSAEADRAAAMRLEQERLYREQQLKEERKRQKLFNKPFAQSTDSQKIKDIQNGIFGGAVEFEEVDEKSINLSDRLRQNRGFTAL